MEILGFGLPEIVLILLLALVILGPRDMTEAARKLARWIYRLFRSPQWREFIGAAREVREMPKQLIREAGIEEEMHLLRQTGQEVGTIARDTSQEIHSATREANASLQEPAQPPPPPPESGNPPGAGG